MPPIDADEDGIDGPGPVRRRTSRRIVTDSEAVGGDIGGVTEPAKVRLQRVMAEAGIASRRECERLIEGGHVAVNGRIMRTLPVLIDPAEDEVRVDGRILPKVRRRGTRYVYIMVYKPARVLSTTRDDPAFADAKGRGRTTVVDLVTLPGSPRLFPVGRLDFHSTGLVLLTNDGELAERLTHARYGVTKTYEVLVKRRVVEGELGSLARAISTGVPASDAPEGRRPKPHELVALRPARSRQVGVEIVKYDADRTVLRVTMTEGANRSVVDVLNRLGFHVKQLRRVGIGPVSLTGVALGQWRPLTAVEVKRLKAAGAAKGKKTGVTAGGRTGAKRSGTGNQPKRKRMSPR